MKKITLALLGLCLAVSLSAQQKFKLFTQVVARPSGTTGDMLYVSDTAGTIARLPAAGTQGQCLLSTGTPILPAWGACTAGGSVTSVGLALPGSVFSVSGSPVTASGTLTGAFLAQSANTVFAGPTSGGSTAPTFRLLVTADYPDETVTFAKLQNIATSKLLGRATTGAGDIEEITLGTGLSFTGTTLNASGAGGGHVIQEAGGALTQRAELNFLAGFDLTDNAGADSSDVALDLSEVAGGGDLSWTTNTPTIPNDTITFAKFQNVAANSILARAAGTSGDLSEISLSASQLAGRGSTGDVAAITLGTNLSLSGTTLNAAGGGGDSTRKGTEAARPAASNDGDLYLPTDGVRLHRDTGTVYDTWGPLFPLTAPVDGDFSWVNQGTASVSTTNGGIFLRGPSGAAHNLRIREKAAPATPWTITAAFLPSMMPADFMSYGLIWKETGTTSTTKIVHVRFVFVGGKWELRFSKYAGYDSSPVEYSGTVPYIYDWACGGPLFLRMQDDGTNRIFSVSGDGREFEVVHTVTRTDFLTATYVGFAVNAFHATEDGGVRLISWKEE